MTTAQIIVMSVFLFISIYLFVRILVFLRVQKDINMIYYVRIKYCDAAAEGKITYAQCDQILEYLDYDKLQKPYWEIVFNPLIWSRKSRFRKGMFDVLVGHFYNLQTL